MPDTQAAAVLPRIRERLARGETVHIRPGGTSMLPVFRPEQDIIILSPLPQTLKKYDVPFYQRPGGKPVLHRIVEVGQTYTCVGDNQFQTEPGVTRAQMLGVVTGFIRDGREHSVEEPVYKLYCRFWHHTRKLRHIIKWPKYYLRRLLTWLKLKP